uniref:Putative secreted protein n=1 Tax=Ixodes ricinus TaxID=34613 RepID=A0A6B0TVL1_IXORI
MRYWGINVAFACRMHTSLASTGLQVCVRHNAQAGGFFSIEGEPNLQHITHSSILILSTHLKSDTCRPVSSSSSDV